MVGGVARGAAGTCRNPGEAVGGKGQTARDIGKLRLVHGFCALSRPLFYTCLDSPVVASASL